MQTNVRPCFFPKNDYSQFSDLIFDFSKPNHIKNVVDTVTNSSNGTKSLIYQAFQNYLNLDLLSSTYSLLLEYSVSLLPILALFAYSSTDKTSLAIDLWHILDFCSTGCTKAGIESLSLGIFQSRCEIKEDGNQVIVMPYFSYSPLRAMVAQNLLRRLAPPTVLYFVRPYNQIPPRLLEF